MKTLKTIKENLKWALKASLIENVISKNIPKADKQKSIKFLKEEATYEQLLNLVYNPKRQERLLESGLLQNISLLATRKLLRLPLNESTETKKKAETDIGMLESLVEQIRAFKPHSHDVVTEALKKLTIEKLGFKIPLNSIVLETSSYFLFRQLLGENLKQYGEDKAVKSSIQTICNILTEAKDFCKTESCKEKYNNVLKLWKSKIK